MSKTPGLQIITSYILVTEPTVAEAAWNSVSGGFSTVVEFLVWPLKKLLSWMGFSFWESSSKDSEFFPEVFFTFSRRSVIF